MEMEALAIFLFTISGSSAIIGTIIFKNQLTISSILAKFLGFGGLGLGMLLVLWAAKTAGILFIGKINPVIPTLVRRGPYRFLRHPVYLGFSVALMGVALVGRSWVGLAFTLLLFFPSCILRARLEEKTLALKFASTWQEYAANTHFIIPFIW